MEKEDCAQLYIGTNWGVIIVTEADQVKLTDWWFVTCFEIQSLIAAQTNHRFATSRWWRQSYRSYKPIQTSYRFSAVLLSSHQVIAGEWSKPNFWWFSSESVEHKWVYLIIKNWGNALLDENFSQTLHRILDFKKFLQRFILFSTNWPFEQDYSRTWIFFRIFLHLWKKFLELKYLKIRLKISNFSFLGPTLRSHYLI